MSPEEKGMCIILLIVIIGLALFSAGCSTAPEEPMCWKCYGPFFDVEHCHWICDEEKLH